MVSSRRAPPIRTEFRYEVTLRSMHDILRLLPRSVSAYTPFKRLPSHSRLNDCYSSSSMVGRVDAVVELELKHGISGPSSYSRRQEAKTWAGEAEEIPAPAAASRATGICMVNWSSSQGWR